MRSPPENFRCLSFIDLEKWTFKVSTSEENAKAWNGPWKLGFPIEIHIPQYI